MRAVSDTPETDAVENHCEELVRAYHTDRMRVGDDRELAKVMVQVTLELLTVSRALERKLAARPEELPIFTIYSTNECLKHKGNKVWDIKLRTGPHRIVRACPICESMHSQL